MLISRQLHGNCMDSKIAFIQYLQISIYLRFSIREADDMSDFCTNFYCQSLAR